MRIRKLTVFMVALACIFVLCSGFPRYGLAQPCECEGDFDHDGDVDGSDLAVFAADFGRSDCADTMPCEGNFDCDGDVDGSDLAVFAADFGRTDCPPPQAYFFDNFECGLHKWVVSGQDWGLTEDTHVTPTHCFTDNPDGNYPNYANSIATMACSMDLSSATFPVLTFWSKAMTYAYSSNDHIYVEVSDDGGWTWHELWHRQNLNQSTWKKELVDLSAYKTSQVKIRFRLVSDNEGTNDGWYIDDVEIREFDDGIRLPYPFYEDFETGTGNWVLSGQDWGLTEDTHVSPTHSLTDSPDGNYPNYAHVVAQTAGFIDLTSATFPVLTFWGKAMTYAYSSNDHIYVEVSDDGGWTWHELWHRQNLNQSTWKKELVDLSAYKTSQVKIRFRLVSDNEGTNDGWYIDDVEIREW
ncbi:choice-of-anchor J domain-containing protein [bacterium]|nr:choice-of-anchor J domain-containing protein [bacterium]